MAGLDVLDWHARLSFAGFLRRSSRALCLCPRLGEFFLCGFSCLLLLGAPALLGSARCRLGELPRFSLASLPLLSPLAFLCGASGSLSALPRFGLTGLLLLGPLLGCGGFARLLLGKTQPLSLGAIGGLGKLLCFLARPPFGGTASLLVLEALLGLRRLGHRGTCALLDSVYLSFGRHPFGHGLRQGLGLPAHRRIPFLLLGFDFCAGRFLRITRLALAPGLLEKRRRFLLPPGL